MSDEKFEYGNDFTDNNRENSAESGQSDSPYVRTEDSAQSSDDPSGTSEVPVHSETVSADSAQSADDSTGTAYAGDGGTAEAFGSAGADHTGSGTLEYSREGQRRNSSESAGTGRFYSYNRTAEGGRTPGTPPRKGGGKKGRGRLAAVLTVILVFVLGASAGALLSSRTKTASLPGSSSSAPSRIEGSASETDNDGAESGNGTGSGGNTIGTVEEAMRDRSLSDTTVADVAEKVMPAIVSVYNKFTEESRFFGRTYTQEGESAGSGIILEETGTELLIVTNNHVVEGADSLSVQFINEENCEASLKGTDTSSDLAVISVPLDALSEETRQQIAIAEIGDSDSLRIGEDAIAIGNALGYGQSLTIGCISALNREITSEDGITGTFIQTDAAINPGNSGGALLNSGGQVIGINSNKIGGDAIEGMGFAIPISKAMPIIDSLKTQQSKSKVAEEDQGVLGIYGISVTSDVASAYGLPVGAYVEKIIEGSGAAQSDLQQGDIITAINGQTIISMEGLQNQLVYYSAGEEVTLTVQHPMEGSEYEEREITVTLSKKSTVSPSSEESGGSQYPGEQNVPDEGQDDFGFFTFPFGF